MRALRPHMHDPREFEQRVDGVLRPEGYRLVGAFVADSADAVGVAGFRVANGLAWGRYLYVDDLSVSPEAQRLGCDQLHLDSGTGPERFDAHRLYHRSGLSIYSHHFARAV